MDEATVLLEDMLPFKDDVDITRYRGKPLEYYAEFMRIYAPILADNLLAKLDGKTLAFTCSDKERVPRLVDEKGQALGHLRCEFTFRAEAPWAGDRESTFTFRENNYLLQEGVILLSFANDAGVKVQRLEAPDEALQKQSPTELKPGDDNRLRELTIVFVRGETQVAAAPVKSAVPADVPTEVEEAASTLFPTRTRSSG